MGWGVEKMGRREGGPERLRGGIRFSDRGVPFLQDPWVCASSRSARHFALMGTLGRTVSLSGEYPSGLR